MVGGGGATLEAEIGAHGLGGTVGSEATLNRASSLERAGDLDEGGESTMTRTMLRAKIHRIRVTECDVEYEGSLTLDKNLMEAVDLLPYEKIDVYNVDNGKRFSTYLIEGERGRGECCVNGAAARLVERGHKLILASYTTLDEEQAVGHCPRVVLIGEGNRIKTLKEHERAGVRVGAS